MQRKDKINPDIITTNFIKDRIAYYSKEAILLIQLRKKNNLIYLQDLLEAGISPGEIEKRFGNTPIRDLWHRGYTNSEYFDCMGYITIPSEHSESPKISTTFSYSLKTDPALKILPSVAIEDLFKNKNTIMIINDMSAINIMWHYTLLKILQETLGVEEGTARFNLVFGALQSKMVISASNPRYGFRDFCTTHMGISAPFDLLQFFVTIGDPEKLAAGHVLPFVNNRYLEFHHPFSDQHTILILVTGIENKELIVASYLTKNEISLSQLAQNVVQNYNQPPAAWTNASWIREDPEQLQPSYNSTVKIPHKIRPKDLPGIKNTRPLMLNPEPIRNLILFTSMFFQLTTYFDIEPKAIEKIRSKYIKSRNIISNEPGNGSQPNLLLMETNKTDLEPSLNIQIEEDAIEDLHKKALLHAKTGIKEYEKNNFHTAQIELVIVLTTSMAIHHYYFRIEDNYKQKKALEQVASCYLFLGKISQELNEIDPRCCLQKAKELYQKLYGFAHKEYYTKDLNEKNITKFKTSPSPQLKNPSNKNKLRSRRKRDNQQDRIELKKLQEDLQRKQAIIESEQKQMAEERQKLQKMKNNYIAEHAKFNEQAKTIMQKMDPDSEAEKDKLLREREQFLAEKEKQTAIINSLRIKLEEERETLKANTEKNKLTRETLQKEKQIFEKEKKDTAQELIAERKKNRLERSSLVEEKNRLMAEKLQLKEEKTRQQEMYSDMDNKAKELENLEEALAAERGKITAEWEVLQEEKAHHKKQIEEVRKKLEQKRSLLNFDFQQADRLKAKEEYLCIREQKVKAAEGELAFKLANPDKFGVTCDTAFFKAQSGLSYLTPDTLFKRENRNNPRLTNHELKKKEKMTKENRSTNALDLSIGLKKGSTS